MNEVESLHFEILEFQNFGIVSVLHQINFSYSLYSLLLCCFSEVTPKS